MSSPKKIGRWNRFEIAFNKGMRLEAEACPKDWREKQGKTRGMEGGERQDEPTFAQETFVETSPSEKRSFAVVRSVWEEARRSKIDAEAKKRADSALKLERTEKSEALKKWERAMKSASQRDFPFLRRPRTRRMSEPPRRFDRLRRDQEDGQD